MKTLPLLSLLLLLAVVSCGRPKAPDLELMAYPGGAGKKLADFRGKAVLIDMWATWCGPCRETMPHIQELYRRYHEKGLEVAAITTDDDNAVRLFLASNPFTYPIYTDPEATANKAFGVTGIPESIVLDRNGGIVWRGHPAYEDQLERAIQAALD